MRVTFNCNRCGTETWSGDWSPRGRVDIPDDVWDGERPCPVCHQDGWDSQEDKILTDYWLKHYLGKTGLCVLCQNSGILQLQNPSGEGDLRYCFCPNGRAKAKEGG